MNKARIYIVPTRFGFLFLFGAVIMIFAGAAYQNNLVNLLAFFMLSLILVTMVQTHNNLKDIEIDHLIVENAYAGGDYIVTTVLKNLSQESKHQISAVADRKTFQADYEMSRTFSSQGTLRLKSAYRASTRGCFEVQSLRISTTYPLGLFRSWQRFDTETKYYVYPERKGLNSFPHGSGETAGLSSLFTKLGGDDYRGHRSFQTGDNFRHIDWKARARGRPLLIKEFNEGPPSAVELDYSKLTHLSSEDRLSQLALWIEVARQQRLPVALILPGLKIQADSGSQHDRKCLEALAGFSHA